MSNKKFYINLTVFLAIYIILIATVVLPLVKEIESNSTRLIEAREEMVFYSVEKSSIHELSLLFEEIDIELEKVDSLFIDSEVPLDFINFLEKLAKDLDIKLTIASVEFKEGEEDSWSYFVFSLDLESDYISFARFLEKLENSSYLIEISQINAKKIEKTILEEEESTKEKDNISTSISLRIFTR